MNSFLIDINTINNLSRVPVSLENNPLVKASKLIIDKKLSEAEKCLKHYYDSLSYKSLNDLFKTKINKLSSYEKNNFFLPWYHTNPTAVKDNAFIEKISLKEIKEKIEKIENLIFSIDKNGYKPSQFIDRKTGHITGYFLEFEKSKKFYVVSGNHRVSVLYALGYQNIPVIFEEKRFFKSRDKINFGWQEVKTIFTDTNVSNWPSVKNGFLEKKNALDIIKSYCK